VHVSVGRLLPNLAVPVVLLIAAWLLVPAMSGLPTVTVGYAVCAVHALGVILGIVFRRGRIVFALLMLAIAYACYPWLLRNGLAGFRARTVFAALCILAPLNFALLVVASERGLFNSHGARRLAVILVQAAGTWWIVLEAKTDFVASVYSPIYPVPLLSAIPIPQWGMVTLVAGMVVALGAWLVRRQPLDLGLAGAIVAFGIAMSRVAVHNEFAMFVAAGGLILTITVLQDTFRMAFRDELTGLPSRRDLNERMMGLGRRYVIAMADVDHFKKFNDTHGHDLGDQVLKMVAMKLAGVGGGGTAYRYGGEEFTVLFPGKDLERALPHLDALRRDIESYRLALRAADRAPAAQTGRRKRGGFRDAKSVSVTISIGVAERNDKLATPEAVIKAADRALYRAKNKGRNQVSR
jgi:diguanylate cyclase (GGDEF)-like protein